MRVITLCWFLSSLYCSAAMAKVTFNIQNQIYQFDQPVRLATVLSIVKNKPSYWANAAVYALTDKQQVEQQRSEALGVLADMIRQQVKNSAEYHHYTSLYQQVGSWQLMRRLAIDVDYDQARLNVKKNPQFNDGDYYIRLHPRAGSVTIIDLQGRDYQLGFRHEFTVVDYLNSVTISANADRDYLYVIEPTGHVQKVGIAYWNREFFKPMPGSKLFIPLQTSLFSSRIEELNDTLANLMTHRM